MDAPDPAVARLLALLDLTKVDRDIFQTPNPGDGAGRLFGGQVASQALRAAANTVTASHAVNSLHAYFLRPGRFGLPVTYLVDRIRDGSSFTTRRVVALQDGEAILNLDASFHADEPGDEFQLESPVDAMPPPDGLERDTDHFGPHRRPIDHREVEPSPARSTRAMWIRTSEALGDDPVLHACVITYLSDSGPVSAARRAIGRGGRRGGWGGDLMTASLDHTLWFHQPARADEWLLYELQAVACGRARGLTRGAMWTQDGRLAVSVTQEALLRPRREA
ncbi:MAG: thioesterase family protein [Acidimicrobiia bacterium]|nr:thioesterase family protein [Acidimicrobiia bacterium]